jgi:hypothetical protein
MEKVHENLRFPRCCQLPLSVAAGGKDRDERWIQPYFGTRHLRYRMYLHMETCLKLTKRTMAYTPCVNRVTKQKMNVFILR